MCALVTVHAIRHLPTATMNRARGCFVNRVKMLLQVCWKVKLQDIEEICLFYCEHIF